MTRPLRVAVVGCGAIAQMMHLPTLAERPDLFAIAGLADIDRATLDMVAARYHVERTTPDYHELLAHDDVDAVLVLASGTHRPFVTAALAAAITASARPSAASAGPRSRTIHAGASWWPTA